MHALDASHCACCLHIAELQGLNTDLAVWQAADQIAVVDNGRIIEQGTHEALADHQGLYAQLISSQSLQLSGTV